MITSVREICKEKGISIKDTCYRNSRTEMLDFRIVSGNFYDVARTDDGDAILRYKEYVEIQDFPTVVRQLPQLKDIRYPIREELPYFTSGLSRIAQSISDGKPVAVEGGPCLFGTDEVSVHVIRKDGRRDSFDYNTGKSYLEQEEEGGDIGFREFVKRHGGEIREVHFENRKPGLTPQEWAFLKYPFEIANALNAPLVIPIPDLSYIKYLDAVLEPVEERVRREALEEFRAISHEICDLYLNVIAGLRLRYPGIRCDVVHDRDRELCARYYAARKPFMERGKILRGLTGFPEKLESVKDYVSMPALPYYLYGIDTVIEVDSMDETDSFRKCRKAHKSRLNLSCILFPELLSKDGIHTIFDAPWKEKEYGMYEVE